MMKKFLKGFIFRGLVACGFGPLALAVVFLILHSRGVVDVLTVEEMCTGIFSMAALAFAVGGINAIYQIERLPLMAAILIHGGTLYLCYLATYLVNAWLKWAAVPVLVFTIIFVVGYAVIWVIIYTVTKKNTAKVNAVLKQKQQNKAV